MAREVLLSRVASSKKSPWVPAKKSPIANLRFIQAFNIEKVTQLGWNHLNKEAKNKQDALEIRFIESLFHGHE
jgi:hypothetical protein